MVEWRTIRCSLCNGTGLASEYTIGGTDFVGATDCSDCGGNGYLYVSPKDRIAVYPGGPFRGTEPGAYDKAEPIPLPTREEYKQLCDDLADIACDYDTLQERYATLRHIVREFVEEVKGL